MAILPRSTAWGDAGEEPCTAFNQVSPRTAPAPRGRGRRPKAGRGGGYRYPGWVETGEGGPAPLPVSPSPNGDTPTVHYMGRAGRRTIHGFPPAIATHCPRPSRAGEEAEGRAGWGFQIPRRGRRRGVLLPPGYLRRAPPSIPTRGRGSSQKRTEKIRSSSRTYSTFSRSSERSPERSTVKKSPPDGSAMVKFIVVSTCTVPSATVISST
ncbi:hypothetical protein L21_0975 [Methanoculleus chikugoensis]|uniref:Uncharacterized protein n=1 Tax=Methanoculleus chikugoensis TaxID=118126 RepID=A0A1M4MJK2_9EURY|nr:hypothetical protein L21_0975 [Methanoculleus chikugoensis]